MIKVSCWRWKHSTACLARVKVSLSHLHNKLDEEYTGFMLPGIQSYRLHNIKLSSLKLTDNQSKYSLWYRKLLRNLVVGDTLYTLVHKPLSHASSRLQCCRKQYAA